MGVLGREEFAEHIVGKTAMQTSDANHAG